MFKQFFKSLLADKYLILARAIIILLLTVGLVFLQSINSALNQMLKANLVKLESGHIRITDKNHKKNTLLKPLNNYEALISRFKNLPEVKTVVPRIKFPLLLRQHDRVLNVEVIATHPWLEDKLTGLEHKIISGRYFVLGRDEVLIGSRLAEKLQLKAGESISILTQTEYNSINAGRFKVAGIYDLGYGDHFNQYVYLPLDKAQELLDLRDKVSEIVVEITAAGEDAKIAREIARDIGDVDVSAQSFEKQKVFPSFFGRIINIICLLLILLSGFPLLAVALFSQPPNWLADWLEQGLAILAGTFSGVLISFFLFLAYPQISLKALQFTGYPFASSLSLTLNLPIIFYAFSAVLISVGVSAYLAARFKKS